MNHQYTIIRPILYTEVSLLKEEVNPVKINSSNKSSSILLAIVIPPFIVAFPVLQNSLFLLE
ncbi:MAG TPA: hypothetical protein DCX01_09195 [Bacteroidetes bacterium]|nr:hypothetical protein [Bacteroidota bacterium]